MKWIKREQHPYLTVLVASEHFQVYLSPSQMNPFCFQLTQVNDRMVEYTQNISHSSPSAALLHTLQRHRDILQDYTHEFQKTRANITALREREDLLGSVRREIKWVRYKWLPKWWEEMSIHVQGWPNRLSGRQGRVLNAPGQWKFVSNAKLASYNFWIWPFVM